MPTPKLMQLPDPETHWAETITVINPVLPGVTEVGPELPLLHPDYSYSEYPDVTFINTVQWQEETYHKQTVGRRIVWKLKEVKSDADTPS